ncbi:MAG: HDOD domain-containing protein [Burkholderiaceae bacterium]|nr:MAG: HDOD domain-containing protein [Burkholderiaceae bacterium]
MLDPARLEELKASSNLPSPRGVALEILRLTQSEQANHLRLVHAIQADPALTGKLIKAANSPLLGMARPVLAVSDAVMLLGISMVRQLVLGFSLVNEHHAGECVGFDYLAYWQDSLLTAVAAHAVAQQMKIANAEETFVLGLLSQVGRLVLASAHPDRYRRLLQEIGTHKPQALTQTETAVFGASHLEIGAALLQDWGFPRKFTLAVGAHEDPERGDLLPHSHEYRIAVVLNLAWEIARLLRAGQDHSQEQLQQHSHALLFHAARVGIDEEPLTMLLTTAVERWKEWAQIFEIQAYAAEPLTFMTPTQPQSAEAPSKPTPIRSLIVDDDSALTQILRRLLVSSQHEVMIAPDGREALEMAIQFQPDIVITDWMMPQMNGLQLTRALRETRAGQNVYILFLTSLDSEERLLEAFDAGVDDYVVKPIAPRALTGRLLAAERNVQQRRALTQDIDEVRRMAQELSVNNRKLQQSALTDPLTGVPNRRYALDRLEQDISLERRRNGALSIIVLDIDYFKRINDLHGHDVGDAVLQHVAGILRAKARLQDSICRIGGEEFLVICPDTRQEDAQRCGERLRSALEAVPYQNQDLCIVVTASFGAVTMTVDMTSSDLMKCADQAVYRAKQQGRNCVVTA